MCKQTIAVTFATTLLLCPFATQSAEKVDMARRAEELKSLRWGMFLCWSFSTFSGKEWTPGVTDVGFFKATGCDTDQWARTAKEAGMGYILFLTKHHDGFCLWDTATTDRKVTRAPLGRDVLAELRKSCDRHGIRLALYFSEGDWTWPGAADGKGWKAGVGKNPEMKKAQLKELLTGYGPIEYIWFDHAVGDGGLNHADTIAFCKSLQPGCFIGFNHGDQAGSDIRLGEMGRPGPLADHGAAGPHMRDAPSQSYLLAEFTYPILPPHKGGAMWFYSLPIHDGLCHSVDRLYRDYLGAVKYGNIFSLDVGPDYAGKLRAVDVDALRAVGKRIREKAPMPAEVASAPLDAEKFDLHAWLQPVPATARFADPNYDIWCGSALRGDDGKYHLFYSRWPRKLSHKAWVTHSEVAHAVADSPLGPWKHRDVALPARGKEYWDGLCTHNPTVLRIGGRYYLYYMGNTGDGVVQQPLNWTHRNNQRIGVAVAESPNGPWQRFDKPIVDVSPNDDAPDSLVVTNPSVAVRPDGGVLMVYKAVGKQRPMPFGGPVVHRVATADQPTGPFRKHPQLVFAKEGVMFAAEDPFIWNDGRRYWAVVKDNAGNFTGRGYSLALFQSADGFDWKLAPHPLVTTPEVTWVDRGRQPLTALERPQLLFENGRPAVLLCAGSDTKDRDASFNVQIPLRAPSP